LVFDDEDDLDVMTKSVEIRCAEPAPSDLDEVFSKFDKYIKLALNSDPYPELGLEIDGVKANRTGFFSRWRKASMEKLQTEIPEDCHGSKRDQRRFTRLFRSSFGGKASSQRKLGIWYKNGGKGVNVDTVKALYWLFRAQNQNDYAASAILGIIFITGHDGRLQPDYPKAFEHLSPEKVCKKSPLADYYVGLMYWHGVGLSCPASKLNAFRHFSRAAASSQGIAKAMNNVAVLHFTGSGKLVKSQPKKGIKWLKKAAKLGCREAEHNLGMCYFEGIGVDKNNEKAQALFKKARDTSRKTKSASSKPISSDLHDKLLEKGEMIMCSFNERK